ncbi:hypothetical protein HDV05_005217 [Chytridiales sp. JEL 0842]|nr:hypothetical protein HDV05_005217 [Chytridiales sp. JEL 0842]
MSEWDVLRENLDDFPRQVENDQHFVTVHNYNSIHASEEKYTISFNRQLAALAERQRAEIDQLAEDFHCWDNQFNKSARGDFSPLMPISPALMSSLMEQGIDVNELVERHKIALRQTFDDLRRNQSKGRLSKSAFEKRLTRLTASKALSRLADVKQVLAASSFPNLAEGSYLTLDELNQAYFSARGRLRMTHHQEYCDLKLRQLRAIVNLKSTSLKPWTIEVWNGDLHHPNDIKLGKIQFFSEAFVQLPS